MEYEELVETSPICYGHDKYSRVNQFETVSKQELDCVLEKPIVVTNHSVNFGLTLYEISTVTYEETDKISMMEFDATNLVMLPAINFFDTVRVDLKAFPYLEKFQLENGHRISTIFIIFETSDSKEINFYPFISLLNIKLDLNVIFIVRHKHGSYIFHIRLNDTIDENTFFEKKLAELSSAIGNVRLAKELERREWTSCLQKAFIPCNSYTSRCITMIELSGKILYEVDKIRDTDNQQYFSSNPTFLKTKDENIFDTPFSPALKMLKSRKVKNFMPLDENNELVYLDLVPNVECLSLSGEFLMSFRKLVTLKLNAGNLALTLELQYFRKLVHLELSNMSADSKVICDPNRFQILSILSLKECSGTFLNTHRLFVRRLILNGGANSRFSTSLLEVIERAFSVIDSRQETANNEKDTAFLKKEYDDVIKRKLLVRSDSESEVLMWTEAIDDSGRVWETDDACAEGNSHRLNDVDAFFCSCCFS